MKRSLATLGVLLALAAPARAQNYQAGKSAAISVSTATTTSLVAAVSGQRIFVTAFLLFAGGTGNATLEYGTTVSTPCDTGTTALTGVLNLTAQTGVAPGNGTGAILFVPAGNALCMLTSAAVQISGFVSYTQQ